MKILIDQQRSGLWRLRVQRPDGKLETIDRYPTRDEAEVAREVVREEIDVAAMTERPLLRVWMGEWLDAREARGVRSIRSDRSRFETHVRRSKVGRTEVASLRRKDLRRFRDGLDPGLSDKTRREVFILVRQALDAAVEAELTDANPARQIALPRQATRKAFSYLYPAEDAALCSCADVPIHFRLVYGVLAREGLRKSEVLGLTWDALDLDRGVVRLDENKTDTPRAWTLRPDVARVLRWWREHGPGGRFVFPSPRGGRWSTLRADRLRGHLEAAGVDRVELFTETRSRKALRVHDLRATFVTLSLAAGRSERWVKDRTGHTTDVQLEQYRRAARTAAEVGLGDLAPLDRLLGVPDGSSKDPQIGPTPTGGRVYRLPVEGLKPTDLRVFSVRTRAGLHLQDSTPFRVLAGGASEADSGARGSGEDLLAALEGLAAVGRGEDVDEAAALRTFAAAALRHHEGLASLARRILAGDEHAWALAAQLVDALPVVDEQHEDDGQTALRFRKSLIE